MRRNRLFLLAALLPALAMQAQTSYEASVLLDTDLSGTARYVGMGGAMSALGADMSTMSTNPAGTALYRSWDAAFSFGANGVTQRTRSNTNNARSFDPDGSFDNGGVVIANKRTNEGLLRFVNFGFNYRNVKRFDGKMGMASGLGEQFSQTEQMAWQAWENIGHVNYTNFDPQSDNNFFDAANTREFFKDFDYGWLTLLGAYGDLMGIYAQEDENGNIMYDEDGVVVEDYWYRLADGCNYKEVVSGGIDAYDFNLSLNFADAVYLGATLTKYDVDRYVESTYSESFVDGGYTLQNFYRTVGSGYDFKLGVILRPFAESSFRVGVSVTTPAVYTLTDYNSAIINSTITYTDFDENDYVIGQRTASYLMDTQSKDAYGGDIYTEYTMISPSKVNFSLGGTIGSSWALGAEYEHTNYASMMLYDENGVENKDMNTHTGENFNGKHTLRLGAEKTFGTFYTRLGYNLQAGGYKKDAWKMIPINSVQTNTVYANVRSTQNFTCGLGFRGDVFYADAALLYSTQKSDFYPFVDILDENTGLELQPTSLSRNLLKGMLTVGMRF